MVPTTITIATKSTMKTTLRMGSTSNAIFVDEIF
jgi:hypothetical protein